jgi:polysaccharide biosynthesis transport protein
MTTINPTRPAIPPAARPGPQPIPGPGAVPAIDPMKLLQKYKWLLGIAAAVGLGLGTAAHFVLLKVYPLYSTQVIFECIPIEMEIDKMGPGHLNKDDFDAFKATQVQILLSDRTIDNAISDPRLQVEAPKWSSQFVRRGVLDKTEAARKLKRNLGAGVVGESNFVRMSFWWTDPDEAVGVANLVARNYAEDRRNFGRREISERLEVLHQQSRAVAEQINQLQKRREATLQHRNVDALDAAVASANMQMKTIAEQLNAISTSKESVQSQLAHFERELAAPAGINFNDGIRKRVDDDLIIQNQKYEINALEARLAQISLVVGPDHRDRRRLADLLEAKRLVLNQETERLLKKTFDAELDGLRRALASLEAQEREQRESHEQARLKAMELTAARKEIEDIDREMERLNESRAKYLEAQKNIEVITAGRNQSRIAIYQNAQRPRTVSFPRLYIMAPLGLVIVLGLVGGLALLVEVVDQRVKSPADVAMIPRTRVLGLIPHAAEDPSAPARIETVFRDQPGGVLAEHFRQLRGAVLKRMQQGEHKTLVIMSGMPDSGATTVVANLALALAAAEQRVLVIDANFRRPGLHKILGLTESPGLADVLAGSRSLAESTQRTDNEHLKVLCAGSPDNRMFERLGTHGMGELLREAASLYDIVLIDVAPAMVSGDAYAVANRADASLLVVRAMGEKRGMVARLRNDLGETRAEFLGVLVNAARSAAGGYLRGNILATHKYRTSEGK